MPMSWGICTMSISPESPRIFFSLLTYQMPNGMPKITKKAKSSAGS